MAASSKKPSLFVSLLLLLLLVSAVHGDEAHPAAADARDETAAVAGDGGERVTTVRTGHGHSSSHSGGHTGGGDSGDKGGAGVVDPRNVNARSHRSGAAPAAGRAALGYSSAVVCGLAGAVLAVVALP